MAGVSSGPTPWWQLPGQGAALKNLQGSAPDGYQYDPVEMRYVRTPQSAGANVNAFESAAFPSLDGLINGSGSGSAAGAFGIGTGTGAATGGGAVAAGGGVAPMQMPDMTASNDAIFAQAKDKVGQLSRASLDSLNDELGAQGMLGSGAQVQGARDIIANGQGELGQVVRDTASKNADTALDVAKTNYQGALTERGQDINAQEANARLALEANQQKFQLLNTVLNSLGKAPGGSQYTLSPSLLY